MSIEPREFSSAAELRANARAVREYFERLPAYAAPSPPPPPTPPEPVIDLLPPPSPPPAPHPAEFVWRPAPGIRIREMVAAHYGFTLAEITGHNRSIYYLMPRYIAIYLCVRYAGLSTPATGRLFGDRDHSTIIHSVRKAKERIAADPQCAADVAEFVRRIEAWGQPGTGDT